MSFSTNNWKAHFPHWTVVFPFNVFENARQHYRKKWVTRHEHVWGFTFVRLTGRFLGWPANGHHVIWHHHISVNPASRAGRYKSLTHLKVTKEQRILHLSVERLKDVSRILLFGSSFKWFVNWQVCKCAQCTTRSHTLLRLLPYLFYPPIWMMV